jgi:cell division protein DivIC
MSRLKRLRSSLWWRRLTNKFVLATLFFLIWMIFLDSNSVLIQFELDDRLKDLEDGILYYQTELKDTQRQLDELASNPEKLEKFAREKYWMHRPGEHILLVDPLGVKDE